MITANTQENDRDKRPRQRSHCSIQNMRLQQWQQRALGVEPPPIGNHVKKERNKKWYVRTINDRGEQGGVNVYDMAFDDKKVEVFFNALLM